MNEKVSVEINLLSFFKTIIQFYCNLLKKQIAEVHVYGIQFKPISYNEQVIFDFSLNKFVESKFKIILKKCKYDNIKIVIFKNNIVFLSDSYKLINDILSELYSIPNIETKFPFSYIDFFKHNIYSDKNEYNDFLINQTELYLFKELLLDKFGTSYNEWYKLKDL